MTVDNVQRTQFLACLKCGAIAAVMTQHLPGGAEESVIDNREPHAEWHRKQDALLKAHDDMLKALTEAVSALGDALAEE